jgi:hypothetical protein
MKPKSLDGLEAVFLCHAEHNGTLNRDPEINLSLHPDRIFNKHSSTQDILKQHS